MIKLLIVEDDPEYMECAMRACEELKDSLPFEVTFVNNFDAALTTLDKGSFDFVITDLFKGDTDIPMGLVVYVKAKKNGITTGILTDGERHGGTLGALRYYLRGEEDFEEAEKLGITPQLIQQLTGWSDPFYHGMLIGGNGTDKDEVANWKKAIQKFLNMEEFWW